MNRTFVLSGDVGAHALWQFLRTCWRQMAEAGKPLQVEVKPYEQRRTVEQNRLMWAVLTDISEQVTWHGQRLSKEDWKEMLTASLKKQRVVPSIDGGGFVILGASTSRMSIAEMSELIELAQAFGAQHGVRFGQ